MKIAKVIVTGLALGLFCMTATSLATQRLVILEMDTNTG